jgi:predicted nucleic acid-binding Zn ribbon protein
MAKLMSKLVAGTIIVDPWQSHHCWRRMGEFRHPKPAASAACSTFLDADSSFKWKERIMASILTMWFK